MTNLYIYYNFPCIYYLHLHIYVFHDIFHIICFSTINNILTLVNNSNFILVSFKHACHANPGTDNKLAGSSPYI